MTAITSSTSIHPSPAPARKPAPTDEQKRCEVLGVGISAINLRLAVETIRDWIRDRQRHYVTVTGVHGVMESQADPQLKRIHNEAGMVTPDGMPMVWLNRLAGNQAVGRVYGPDLMLAVCEESSLHGWRHFFYGGGDGVADLLADRLKARFPKLDVVGTYCPPFRKLTEEEQAEVVERIDALKPDIVWVGLSTPKQEYWMHAFRPRLEAPVLVGVGAAFDFHAGLKKQAPAWMQRNGLEWLFRLCTEPRRLWKRYLTNNPRFLWYLLLERFTSRDFGEPAGDVAEG